MLLFFIPLALIVAHLNRLMPLEGGLYEWARLAFNDQIGFLVAWNLWLFIMLYVAVIGLVTSTFLAYAVPSLPGWPTTSGRCWRVGSSDRGANVAGRTRLQRWQMVQQCRQHRRAHHGCRAHRAAVRECSARNSGRVSSSSARRPAAHCFHAQRFQQDDLWSAQRISNMSPSSPENRRNPGAQPRHDPSCSPRP